MPLQRCEGDGWRWGDAGKCYHGTDAKRRAIDQGLAEGEGTLKSTDLSTTTVFQVGNFRTLKLLRRAGRRR